jgi:hypothetical protein
MIRYYFNRNGATVCGRDTLEECLDYAKRTMGWDIRLKRDSYRTEFTTVICTYSVEEISDDAPRTVIRTFGLDKFEAVMPL